MTYPFGGATYKPARDGKRLSKQFERVRDLMLDGEWRTLRDIADALGIPESSASARLRDLRKPEFGSYLVERRYIDNGLYRYRVRAARVEVVEHEPITPPPPPSAPPLFDPTTGSRPLGAYDELDAA